nr:amino acid adenylation domain-containing protein [Gammaproteobacteria bacterium]
MAPINKEAFLVPLLPAQESIYFDSLLSSHDSSCNIGIYQEVTFKDVSDIELLSQSWKLLERHIEGLRTILVEQEAGASLQAIFPAYTSCSEMEYFDFSDDYLNNNYVTDWMREQVDKPLSYNDIGAVRHRFAIIFLGKNKYYLFLIFHRLFNDRMGAKHVLDVLRQVHHCLKSKESLDWLNELPTYRDCVLQARSYLNSWRYGKDSEYWKAFANHKKITRLPVYYPPAPDYIPNTQYVDVELPKDAIDAISYFVRKQKLSPLTMLIAAVSVYFSKILNIEEPVFGLLMHGRQGKRSMPIIGRFSNEVSMSTAPTMLYGNTFEALAAQVQNSLKEVFKHSHYPRSHLSLLYNNQAANLHDIQIVYDTFPQQTQITETVSSAPRYLAGRGDGQPLRIRLVNYCSEQNLTLQLSYSERYFSDIEARLLSERLIQLMCTGAQKPSVECSSFSLLLEQEKQLTLVDWNKSQTVYPVGETLVSLFEQQVAKRPNATALIFEEASLSYAELNARANAVANGLRQAYQEHAGTPLTADTLIALYLCRSIEMVVSILGVLKAGGAYVPLSPEYPQSRVVYILKDTQAPIVVCQSHYQARLTDWCTEDTEEASADPLILSVDAEPKWLGGINNLSPVSGPRDLAYVIYTSGTTGQPKGVMVEHHNVVHLITAQQALFKIEQYDSGLLFADMVFDASVSELFVNLLMGIRCILCSEEERLDTAQLIKLAEQYHIEWATLPPAVLAQLDTACWPTLKTLVVAGETPSLDTLRRFNNKGIRLFNAYGPTEVTVCTTAHHFRTKDTERCIGQPIANTQVYVLDEQLNPVPIGAVGELYIGGAGVARGYLNRENLTAERFITNPFASAEDREKGYTRLYKSGDLVRWVMDAQGAGQLEYRGRNDMQVKIRGYRIELGGIEAVLGAQRGVRQAVVIDRKQGDQRYLAGYVVMHAEAIFDRTALHSALTAALPAYMVPASLMAILSVPLTINGKLNRKALPAPEWLDESRYVAPRTALEVQLCRLWAEVLGLKRVGIRDHFFRIGGDSIVSLQLVNRLRMEGLQLWVKDIFAAPTIAQ